MIACARTLLLVLALTGIAGATPPPLLVLISIDGCSSADFDRFQPPYLGTLARAGAVAEKLIPSFPVTTFPNHHSIATGLRPEHHGIIGNKFFDSEENVFFDKNNPIQVAESRWWAEGEPIWITAGRQGLRTAALLWPGTTAEIQGRRPNFWKPFDRALTSSQLTETLLSWLARPAAERPQLALLYFDDVDVAGHTYGPGSLQVRAALLEIDHCIDLLMTGIQQLGIETNVVIVSDHGMAPVTVEETVFIEDYIEDPSLVQLDFRGTIAGLRPLEGSADDLYASLPSSIPHVHVYRRETVPAELHFRDHPRIAPIIMIADEGWRIDTRANLEKIQRAGWRPAGEHGWEPTLPSMAAFFIAHGPSVRAGVTLSPFENIHIYNLLCQLAAVTPAPNDGDERLLPLVLH